MLLALAMTLPENTGHLSLLRRAVREALAASQVGAEDTDDIEVLVGELATNSLVHARSEEGIHVEVSVDGDLVLVVVTDTGVGFERSALTAPGTPRPAADECGGGPGERWGGWGLPLVESLAERVEFSRNDPRGTRVRAFKRLRV